MIDHIKTLLAGILRHALKILAIGRVHPNRVVFFSYFGTQYSCNPKYISEYLSQEPRHMQFDIVWAFVQPDKFKHLEQQNIRIIKYNSLSFLRICLTSRYIITNSETPAWFPLTRKQTLINTWHGGGAYKKVGSAYQKETSGKQARAAIARKNPCIYLSSSQAFSDLTIYQSFHHHGDIIACGMPRNDLLINRNHEELYIKIKNLYHIPEGHHILLYAPTYRDSKKASEYLFDCSRVSRALSKRFGGKWTILFRMHYFVVEQLASSNEYIDVSNYPDMQELLYISDSLITDYSSSMWDFALTCKPCFLYATDLCYYDLSRGFYTDIHTWPYPLAENTDQLTENILHFDTNTYKTQIEKHFVDLGSFETGHASQKVYEYMVSHI